MDRNLIQQVEKLSVYSDDKSDNLGEVFTPTVLIEQMCDAFPKSAWSNQTYTFLDPCAGNGNMPAVIVTRLIDGLKNAITDETSRYKHIMEKQLYMAEYQQESARNIERIFNPDGKLKLNLYVGDFLRMPDDFWDLPYESRLRKYPQHHISSTIPDHKRKEGKAYSRPLF